MSASAMVNINYPIGKSIFAVNLRLKLFPATVANDDFGSLKSLNTLFDKYSDHTLVEFEQNCVVHTTRNFKLFESVDAIFEDVSVAETIV